VAVVDFEAGGCSSVTFSPDTGAVIRERKVRESPRKVEGAYIQPLPALKQGERFHGYLGLYLLRGKLAFFRRSTLDQKDQLEGVGCAAPESEGVATPPLSVAWESTGFISDLSWASGTRLTPCLAFRASGAYVVRIASMTDVPPMPVEAFGATHNESSWNALDWEAEDPEDFDEPADV
jgi:hypothetical protein